MELGEVRSIKTSGIAITTHLLYNVPSSVLQSHSCVMLRSASVLIGRPSFPVAVLFSSVRFPFPVAVTPTSALSVPPSVSPSRNHEHPTLLPPMADWGEDSENPELTEKQKKEIAKWFLSNAPVGEIQYVAKDVRLVIGDDRLYELAAAEAFPLFNKAHLVVLEMPHGSGDVIITSFGEIDGYNFFDPRTAQVATVDHVKQVCTKLRPANDEELPSAYVEEFRFALEAELYKYVGDTYPKGTCAVYCTRGKDVEGPGVDFDFAVVISASRTRPQNFCNGSWRSIWIVEFKDDLQVVEVKGKMQVVAHYFEEGNVQLDAKNECRDSTILQSPEDFASSISNIIRHHEAKYMTSLEESYLHLSDTTFKDLRRKLPVTRTLFPWQNALQFSLTRDISRELGIGK